MSDIKKEISDQTKNEKNREDKKSKRKRRFHFRFRNKRREKRYNEACYQVSCLQKDCQIQFLQMQLRKMEGLVRNLIEYSQLTEDDIKNIVEKKENLEKLMYLLQRIEVKESNG